MERLEKSYSLFVEQILPQHVSENNPGFVSFLKSYFDWLEKENNVHNVLHDFGETYTSDFFEKYYDLYKSEYFRSYPETLPIDKTLFVKIIRDIYASKGTPESIRFFFKTLFNEDVELVLPQERKLLPFGRKKYLVRSVVQNLTYEGYRETLTLFNKLCTTDNKSTCYVDDISLNFITNDPVVIDQDAPDSEIVFSGTTIYDITLSTVRNRSGFEIGDNLYEREKYLDEEGQINYSEEEISLYSSTLISVLQNEPIGVSILSLSGLLGSSTINSAGTNYAVGDVILFPTSGNIQTAKAIVSSVSPTGAITAITIQDPGVGYTANVTITAAQIQTLLGTGANITFNLSGIFDKTLTDNRLVTKQFEYVVKTGIPENVWGSVLTDIVHPAGVKYSGELTISSVATKTTGANLDPAFADSRVQLSFTLNDGAEVFAYRSVDPIIDVYKNDTIATIQNDTILDYTRYTSSNGVAETFITEELVTP